MYDIDFACFNSHKCYCFRNHPVLTFLFDVNFFKCTHLSHAIHNITIFHWLKYLFLACLQEFHITVFVKFEHFKYLLLFHTYVN